MIGLNVQRGAYGDMVVRYLESAGITVRGRVDRAGSGEVVLVDHHAMADTVRAAGGRLVHVESSTRPWYPNHQGPNKVAVAVGDTVVCGMRPVASVLSELVAVVSREVA